MAGARTLGRRLRARWVDPVKLAQSFSSANHATGMGCEAPPSCHWSFNASHQTAKLRCNPWTTGLPWWLLFDTGAPTTGMSSTHIDIMWLGSVCARALAIQNAHARALKRRGTLTCTTHIHIESSRLQWIPSDQAHDLHGHDKDDAALYRSSGHQRQGGRL